MGCKEKYAFFFICHELIKSTILEFSGLGLLGVSRVNSTLHLAETIKI
jgi:hypothetical protein